MERLFKTQGRIYHQDLEIKFEDADAIQGVLQCHIINTGDALHCKHWNKNAEQVRRESSQYLFKIQHAHSFTATGVQLGVMIRLFKTMRKNCSSIEMFVFSFLELCPELLHVLQHPTKLVSRAILRCIDSIPLETCDFLSHKVLRMRR